MASQHKIRILGFNQASLAKLTVNYKFFSKVVIPAGTYSGQTGPVETIAVRATLVCRADLDGNLVYNLTKTLYENLGAVGHAKAKEFSLANAKAGVSTPIHPGALRYYKEAKVK